MVRICVIAFPVLYLLGAAAQATIYVTSYANTGWMTAAVYGARWPVTALYASGVL